MKTDCVWCEVELRFEYYLDIRKFQASTACFSVDYPFYIHESLTKINHFL
jgi:hypothetical protein